jgi:SEC-C motif-containing protein
MRSRYCAYALGGFGDYLLQTWFPATAHGLTAADLSQRHFDWLRLEVMAKSQSGDNGEVEFRAYFREIDTADSGEDVMHECSAFKRIRGRWYYVGGRIT